MNSYIDYIMDLWILTHQDLRHIPRVRHFLDFMTERIRKDRERFHVDDVFER